MNASVGQVAGVSGELYKPLVVGKRYFVAPRAYYDARSTSFFSGSQQLAEYTEKKNGFGVDLGYQFNSKTELRLGEDYQWYGETLKVGTPIEQAFHITPFVSNARFQYLGQDSVQVPTRGTELRTLYTYSTQSPNSSVGYSQWDTMIAHFIPVRKSRNHLWERVGRNELRGEESGIGGVFAGRTVAIERVQPRRTAGERLFSGADGISLSVDEVESGHWRFDLCRRDFMRLARCGAAPGTPTLPIDVSGALVVKIVDRTDLWRSEYWGQRSQEVVLRVGTDFLASVMRRSMGMLEWAESRIDFVSGLDCVDTGNAARRRREFGQTSRRTALADPRSAR